MRDVLNRLLRVVPLLMSRSAGRRRHGGLPGLGFECQAECKKLVGLNKQTPGDMDEPGGNHAGSKW
jgi:hypothetical protein